jgi:hypothetical protein
LVVGEAKTLYAAGSSVIAAVLIVAFAAPAFAIDYYVALRLGGGGCKVMMLTPNPKKFKVMGTYASRAQAKKAMAGMTKCQ